MKEQILKMVEKLNSDTSVPIENTVAALEDIRDKCQEYIAAAEVDILE